MKRFMRRHEISMSGRIFTLASLVHLYRFICICLYLFAKCLPLFVWPLINLYCVAGGSHWVFIWNNNEFTHKDCDRTSIEWWSHLWHSLFIAANSETLERAGTREKNTDRSFIRNTKRIRLDRVTCPLNELHCWWGRFMQWIAKMEFSFVCQTESR